MVDTKEVAEHLGTDSKILRRFLRSPACPIKPVGSGGRYRFTSNDLPSLKERFQQWAKGKDVRPSVIKPRPPVDDQLARDREVWAQERRTIVFENINDPKVRARVRAKAKDQEARLEARLLSKGLHITQWRDRRDA